MSQRPAFLSGGLASITSLPQLIKRLEPYFLSSSLGQPPGASPSKNGGRTIAITNKTQSAASAPKQVTAKALVGGTLTWNYNGVPFASVPIIEITPVGPPPLSGGVPAVLYIQSAAANAVIITSTINTDTRQLHITATGNPN